MAARLKYTEKVAKFTLEDFRGIFAPGGWRIEAIYGNYLLEPFDGIQSPWLLMIAQKEKIIG